MVLGWRLDWWSPKVFSNLTGSLILWQQPVLCAKISQWPGQDIQPWHTAMFGREGHPCWWIQGSWYGKGKGVSSPLQPPSMDTHLLSLCHLLFFSLHASELHLPAGPPRATFSPSRASSLPSSSPSSLPLSPHKCNALALRAVERHSSAPHLPSFLHWSLLQHRGSKTKCGKPHPHCKLKTASTRPGWIKDSTMAFPRLTWSPEETIPWASHHQR